MFIRVIQRMVGEKWGLSAQPAKLMQTLQVTKIRKAPKKFNYVQVIFLAYSFMLGMKMDGTTPRNHRSLPDQALKMYGFLGRLRGGRA